MDIVERLRLFGSVSMDEEGRLGPFETNPLTAAAADKIERLSTALALAVGELSTHGKYAAWTPEMLMNQFLEEARRG